MSAPAANQLVFDYVTWHGQHEQHGADHRSANDDDGFGEEFFRYHREGLDRDDAFRDTQGMPPVAAWDSATQPPAAFNLPPGQACAPRNDPYVPVPQPSWTKLEGG